MATTRSPESHAHLGIDIGVLGLQGVLFPVHRLQWQALRATATIRPSTGVEASAARSLPGSAGALTDRASEPSLPSLAPFASLAAVSSHSLKASSPSWVAGRSGEMEKKRQKGSGVQRPGNSTQGVPGLAAAAHSTAARRKQRAEVGRAIGQYYQDRSRGALEARPMRRRRISCAGWGEGPASSQPASSPAEGDKASLTALQRGLCASPSLTPACFQRRQAAAGLCVDAPISPGRLGTAVSPPAS